MSRVEWWQSQLDWHELNRDADPKWHDSQVEYYRAAIVWGSPRACLDIPFCEGKNERFSPLGR